MVVKKCLGMQALCQKVSTDLLQADKTLKDKKHPLVARYRKVSQTKQQELDKLCLALKRAAASPKTDWKQAKVCLSQALVAYKSGKAHLVEMAECAEAK